MTVALPIPEPRSDDDEDVHWALSTAAALFAGGESTEALKWLRRAADTANDANRDDRALELYKAAADFTSRISDEASKRANAPPLGPPTTKPSDRPPQSARPTRQSRPPIDVAASQQRGASRPPPLPPLRPSAPAGPMSAVEPMAATAPFPRPAVPPPGAQRPGSVPPRAPAALRTPGPVPPKPPSAAVAAATAVRPADRSQKTLASNFGYEDAARLLGGPRPAQPPARAPAPVVVREAAKLSSEPRGKPQDLPEKEKPAERHAAAYGARSIEAGKGTAARQRTRTERGKRATQQPRLEPAQRPAPATDRMASATLEIPAPAPTTPGGPDVPAAAPTVPGGPPMFEGRRRTRSGTNRFDDEVTVQRDFRGLSKLSTQFDDLDERTNVLSARGADAKLSADLLGKAREAKEPTKDESRTPTVVMSVPFARERAASPPPPAPSAPLEAAAIVPLRDPGIRPPNETATIATHRVALVADGSKISVLPLARGESPHPDLLVVLLVPTDPATSAKLAAMMDKFESG